MSEPVPIHVDSGLAEPRRRPGRLALLLVLLAIIVGVYVVLPRSWFEVPDGRAPAPARHGARPADGPREQPSLETLRQDVRQAPRDFSAHTRYAMALASAGNPREAEQEFLAARRLEPDLSLTHHNLGVHYLNVGRLDLADEAFSRELEISPGDPRAHYYRGLVAQRRLRTPEAIAHFRYTIALAQDFPDAYLALAIQATRVEPEEKIRHYVKRYVELTGNEGMGSYVLSGAYRTWGRYPEAAAHAEQSVKAEPKNYAYWHNLGQIYSYAKRSEDAERALGRALELAQDPSTVLIELGMNAQAARRYPDAVAYFRRALAASPATGNIHSYLSRAYRLMGDEVSGERELQLYRRWERTMRARQPRRADRDRATVGR